MKPGSTNAVSKKKSLSLRLLVVVILFSSILTLVTSAFQLYFDYIKNVEAIHSDIEFIQERYLSAIQRSIFFVDDAQVQVQLEGLLKIPNSASLRLRWRQTTS